jgi:hypothetical protein
MSRLRTSIVMLGAMLQILWPKPKLGVMALNYPLALQNSIESLPRICLLLVCLIGACAEWDELISAINKKEVYPYPSPPLLSDIMKLNFEGFVLNIPREK